MLERAPGVELLDDPLASPDLVRESLRCIEQANRWFGGAWAVRFGLSTAFAGAAPPDAPVTLLDVGTGLGDLPRMARAWAASRGITLVPLGLERNTVAARLAHGQGLPVLVGDGGLLPIRDRAVDVVLLSQVAHHFAPDAIVQLLTECNRVARRAVILADLRRSRVAALGFSLAGRAMGFDPDTLRDGVTSLRRGFSPGSLVGLLAAAGISARVFRRPGARLVAVWQPQA